MVTSVLHFLLGLIVIFGVGHWTSMHKTLIQFSDLQTQIATDGIYCNDIKFNFC